MCLVSIVIIFFTQIELWYSKITSFVQSLFSLFSIFAPIILFVTEFLPVNSGRIQSVLYFKMTTVNNETGKKLPTLVYSQNCATRIMNNPKMPVNGHFCLVISHLTEHRKKWIHAFFTDISINWISIIWIEIKNFKKTLSHWVVHPW